LTRDEPTVSTTAFPLRFSKSVEDAITVFNVVYPLQVVGVCLGLLLMYLGGAKRSEPERIRIHIIQLGKYCLFGCVTQIAFS
jgi:hypothetical protein